ncbi:hypothetical protein FGG78_20035 [Thioclava sp. BHET1]|nr:hypothetical protein FGG78_20035 [Thioclava sp. BHET1]
MLQDSKKDQATSHTPIHCGNKVREAHNSASRRIAYDFAAMNTRSARESFWRRSKVPRAICAGLLVGLALSHAALTTIENLRQTLTDCGSSSAAIAAEEAAR